MPCRRNLNFIILEPVEGGAMRAEGSARGGGNARREWAGGSRRQKEAVAAQSDDAKLANRLAHTGWERGCDAAPAAAGGGAAASAAGCGSSPLCLPPGAV